MVHRLRVNPLVHEIPEVFIREHAAREADDPETLWQMLPDVEIEK
jgi:hypothetical protein